MSGRVLDHWDIFRDYPQGNTQWIWMHLRCYHPQYPGKNGEGHLVQLPWGWKFPLMKMYDLTKTEKISILFIFISILFFMFYLKRYRNAVQYIFLFLWKKVCLHLHNLHVSIQESGHVIQDCKWSAWEAMKHNASLNNLSFNRGFTGS